MRQEEQVSKSGNHVRIRPGETTEWKYLVELLSKAVEVANANNLRSYLIDVRGIKSGLNIIDQYRIAYDEGRKIGFADDSRVAVLVDAGDRSRDFVEMAVQNAGYSCKVFEEESEATRWFDT